MTFYVWNRGRHGFSDPLVKVFKVTTTQSPERMLEMSVNHAYVLYDEFSILCCDNACVYDLVRLKQENYLGKVKKTCFGLKHSWRSRFPIKNIMFLLLYEGEHICCFLGK